MDRLCLLNFLDLTLSQNDISLGKCKPYKRDIKFGIRKPKYVAELH